MKELRVPLADSSAEHAGGKYTVIVEGRPSASAPYLTLAKALRRLGRAVRLVPARQLGRREWVRVLRGADAVVLVHYQSLDAHLLGQMAIAATMSVPIIRWWVGTDVLNVITREDVRRSAKRFDGIVASNVAVAPHLVEELAGARIRARYVPSVLDPELADPPVISWENSPRPVVTYLPGSRKDFYGLEALEQVVSANPDLHFIILADDTHALAAHANVESLGWVGDMQDVYARAGCILRITEHDGLPRMLMEGLLRGMYAIYTWPMDGCWQARTVEEIHAALVRYRGTTVPNLEGRAAMLELRRSRPDRTMAELIASARVPGAARRHGIALALQAKLFPERLA